MNVQVERRFIREIKGYIRRVEGDFARHVIEDFTDTLRSARTPQDRHRLYRRWLAIYQPGYRRVRK